jgi:hypothetical protein
MSDITECEQTMLDQHQIPVKQYLLIGYKLYLQWCQLILGEPLISYIRFCISRDINHISPSLYVMGKDLELTYWLHQCQKDLEFTPGQPPGMKQLTSLLTQIMTQNDPGLPVFDQLEIQQMLEMYRAQPEKTSPCLTEEDFFHRLQGVMEQRPDLILSHSGRTWRMPSHSIQTQTLFTFELREGKAWSPITARHLGVQWLILKFPHEYREKLEKASQFMPTSIKVSK